jgi:PAS domain S-box-containing protein
MSLIILTSILIRLAAIAWCLRLMRSLGDRRFALLATMLGLMAARQLGVLASIGPEHTGLAVGELWELPSLLVSVLGLLTAVYLGNYARDLQATNDALKNSEERYRKLFEQSPDIVCVIALDEELMPTTVLDANKRTLEALGYERHEMIGRPISEFDVHAEQRRVDRTRLVQRDGYIIFDTEWLAKDGSHIPAEIKASITTLGGRPVALGTSRDLTAERSSNTKLRETTLRFQQLVENIDQGFYLYEIDTGEILYSSPAWERISGVPAAEVLADPMRGIEIAHPDDLPELRKQLAAAAAGKTSDVFEYRIIRPDGIVRWIATKNFLVPGRLDTGDRVAGIITDITDTKRAIDELRESEVRFRQLAENIPEAFYLYDHNSASMLYASPHYETLVGVTDIEMLENPMAWFRNVIPEDRERMAEASNAAAGGATFDEIEFRVRLANDRIRWIHIRSFEIPMPEGNKRTAGVATDVTETKLAHEALLNANRDLAHAHRIAGIGSGEIHLDTGEVILSERALELFGLQPGTTVFKRQYLDLVYAEDRKKLLKDIDAVATGEHPGAVSFETRMCRPDGTVWWAAITCERVAAATGASTSIRGTFQDVTERKRLEELLRSLATVTALAEEHERHRLAAALHDGAVQNLGLCRIRLGQLRAEMTPYTELSSQIDGIVDLVDATIRDTRNLLSEISPPVLTELGLVPAIEWLADEVEARSDIALEIDTSGVSAELSDDLEVLMFQTMRELLANVEKHSGADSAAIKLTTVNGLLTLRVSDDGHGIPAEAQTTGPTEQGGYGLFSIRERLRLLGGHIDIKSSEQGTVIAIELPLTAADALLVPRPDIHPHKGKGSIIPQ